MEFENLLLGTLSPDEQQRTWSENALTDMRDKQPDAFGTQFLQCMRRSDKNEVQQVAAVLFRRYSFNVDPDQSFFPKMQPATQLAVREELLQALADESPPNVRHKIVDAIAHVAKNIAIAHDEAEATGHFWPEILHTLWQTASSPNPALRENALQIFSVLPGIFGDQLQRYVAEIKQLLVMSLQDMQNQPVQLAATKAFAAFVMVLGKKNRPHFQDVIPLVIQVVAAHTTSSQSEAAATTLEYLINIVERLPKFVRSNVSCIIDAMRQIAANTQADDGCRRMALELLTVLAEEAPHMVRKHGQFVQLVIPVCLQVMTEIEDDDGWGTVDAVEDDDVMESNFSAAEQNLDRICCALGGKAVLELALSAIPALLVHESWNYRYAGLMAISALGEGCQREMRSFLESIVTAVLPLLDDPHPRVRFAACNAIGQMATDFAPTTHLQTQTGFQSMFHASVIPPLLRVLNDNVNGRVQAHALAALVQFCEYASREILQHYLNDLLSKAVDLLGSNFVIVQEQTVITIATIAESAGPLFKNYYDAFMPRLKHILAQATDKRYRLLRGKVMECISLIGISVGKEMFVKDAEEVMMMIQHSRTSEEGDDSADDPQTTYLLGTWARICQILGSDFIPYMHLVMPALLESVTLEPDLNLLDDDLDADKLEGGREAWEIIGLDNMRIGIRTSSLEEKRMACEMLCVYARTLEGGFGPFVPKVFEITQKHLKFYFDDGVRASAGMCMPYLLNSAQACPELGPQVAAELWLKIAECLLPAIKSEPELEVVTPMICGLKECVDIVQANGLSEIITKQIAEGLAYQVSCHMERFQDRFEERQKDPDYDPEMDAHLSEEEEMESAAMKELTDCIHSLFGALREKFMPFLEPMIPHFSQMLEAGHPFTDRQWALCVFDDILEVMGKDSQRYAQFFLEKMILYVLDEMPEVRQAASYGCGVMGLYGGPAFLEAGQEALQRLAQAINNEQARDPGNVDATENAISAVVKIVMQEHMGVDLSTAIPMIVGWLPVTVDDEEAEYIYGYLCDLLDAQNPIVLQLGNLHKILASFGEVAGTALVPKEDSLYKKIMTTLHKLHSSIPTEFGQVWEQLSEEQRGRLS